MAVASAVDYVAVDVASCLLIASVPEATLMNIYSSWPRSLTTCSVIQYTFNNVVEAAWRAEAKAMAQCGYGFTVV